MQSTLQDPSSPRFPALQLGNRLPIAEQKSKQADDPYHDNFLPKQARGP